MAAPSSPRQAPLQVPSLEELAGSIAGISRKAFVHASSAIGETALNATDNWQHIGALVQPTDADRRVATMTLRIPARPDKLLDAFLRPRRQAGTAPAPLHTDYGSLWDAGEPTGPLGPFQVRVPCLLLCRGDRAALEL